jgi:transcriptional regulator with GAF, ATPase, and Fis domain
MTPEEESFESGLLDMAGMLLSGESASSVLAAVTSLAQRVLPNCDAASISLVHDGRTTTPVCSAELAKEADESQYDTGQGPCLEAIRSGLVVRLDSLTESDEWPDFSARAAAQGVSSVLSLPLYVREEVTGALNLYSLKAYGFDEVSERSAAVFARQAAAVLANAAAVERAEELARHLTVALEHRDVIGQAKGILMATEGIGPDEAFDLLRRASQRSNRKLYELATEMVERRRRGGQKE